MGGRGGSGSGSKSAGGAGAVRAAYKRVGGEHVYLSDLRRELAAGGMTDRATQNEAIRQAGRQSDIFLSTQANLRALTPADRAAAFEVGGNDVHLIRIGH